jgi:general bacterial porin, GBP family
MPEGEQSMDQTTRRALALAIGGLGLVSGQAFAQSSVTLYGIVDGGFTYTSNQGGKANYQATAGSEQGSRWGFTGNEDLGGGNHAIFRLENGFNLMTGTASANGRIFGRQAWVGLSNDQWGSLTFGRQYNASQDSLEPLQVAVVTSQYGTHPFDTDDLNNTFRTDNSVKYVTPNFHGLTVNSMYGFSNNAGNFATNRSWSVGASYAGGPLQLGAAYVQLDNPATDTTGAIPSDNYFTFIKGISQQRIWGLGGVYNFGNLGFGAMYTNVAFELTPPSQHQNYQNAEVSVRYQITPALHAAIGETWTGVNANGQKDSWHYWQTTSALQYFLSKRTDVYVDLIYQRATNAVAQIEGTSGPSSSGNQFLVVTGVRQKF